MSEPVRLSAVDVAGLGISMRVRRCLSTAMRAGCSVDEVRLAPETWDTLVMCSDADTHLRWDKSSTRLDVLCLGNWYRVTGTGSTGEQGAFYAGAPVVLSPMPSPM